MLLMVFITLADANTTVSYKRGYSLPHKNLCKQVGLHLRLLILVASLVKNAAQRDAIRYTWGHYARSSHVAVAFVLGAPDSDMLSVLAAEDALYGDLIIGNSDQLSLLFKMASMFDWTHAYCLNSPRLFTMNDRVFVNVKNLLRLVEAPEYANAKLTVWGDFTISNEIRDSDVYLFSNDTIVRLVSTTANITSNDKVLLSSDTARDVKRYNVPYFINTLQESCNITLHVACRIFFHYQQYELWQSTFEPRNVTRNVINVRKTVSNIVERSGSLRRMKPVINTDFIMSLFCLLLCIF